MPLPFEVTILGVNSALPVFGRHPSCQVVRYGEHYFMIDCGEGSQVQLTKHKIKRSKISHILISHLHGDHCFGLPGLLTSMSLMGRKKALSLHGPVGLRKFVETVVSLSGSHMSFELNITEYDTLIKNTIPLCHNLEAETFPLQHRIPTMGYLLKEIEINRNIDPLAISKYQLSVEDIKAAKAGLPISRDKTVVPEDDLILPITPKRAYGYASDTIYDPSLSVILSGVTTLYHETTYLEDLKQLADERYHTVLPDAVKIAREAGVNKLITGHYSSRYKDISIFLKEGRKLWSGVELGEEGRTYQV